MSAPVEDYALIGDCEAAALVSREGSIDWLCLPRFDSEACFAALLGTPEHGHWRIRPVGPVRSVRRRYRDATLVLETEFDTDQGRVALIDFMPVRDREPNVMRIVEGRSGRVDLRTELVIRFGYGELVPWVRRRRDGLLAVAGPDSVRLTSEVPLRGEDYRTVGDLTVAEGERVGFSMAWSPSHRRVPRALDPGRMLKETEAWWLEWSCACSYDGRWRDAVVRSLVTLKALTYAPTGGIVAAPTTSLPEQLGGTRNWDYRYCWIRDATFTLYALMQAGYTDEACAWRDWLMRAVAGKPSQIQALYGIAGERRLLEFELPWLPGYEKSAPVRAGNHAYTQLQLDAIGEIMDAMHVARSHGLHPDENAWRVQQALAEHLESIWSEPDEGIWEVRGRRRHFTHSKVMAWVAFDRAAKAVERFGLDGPVERWRALRDRVHAQVCREGFDPERGAFVQRYGSQELDASLLMIPLVGFLPASDSRVRGTVEAIRRELAADGLVRRYRPESAVDGLPGGEGAFLLCSFWLADNLAMMGRRDEAVDLFQRLLALRNDVGLLSEEYDTGRARLAGNFPQAFSHVALINTARNLEAAVEERPSARRSRR